MEPWILFTLLAATMQAVRTAAQKQISRDMSSMAVTTTRYLFGLPFALIYLAFINGQHENININTNETFFLYAILASIAQILATTALIKTFQYRNFAVGTSFAKTEAILTAVGGFIFFGSVLSLGGWLGVLIGVAGTLIMSYTKFSIEEIWHNPSTRFGLASGLGFAFTSLWLREASLALETNKMVSAAFTLVVMVAIQTGICVTWLFLRERGQFLLMYKKRYPALFVGLTSALGSVGWFTAMSMENPALVKTLGQVEFFITLFITYFLFKEKISKREALGMSLIILSVVILLRFK